MIKRDIGRAISEESGLTQRQAEQIVQKTLDTIVADMLVVEGYGQRDPAAYKTPQPMKRLSYASRLIDIAASGKHHDVEVDAVSLQRLIGWVDAMCPCRGDEEVREIDDPVFQGVDWLSIRPRIKTAPRIVRFGSVD